MISHLTKIVDFSDLIKDIEHLDPTRLKALHGYIKSELQPTIEAIRRINPELNLTPTLIILDLEMPVLNGWEFLRRFDVLDTRVKNQFSIIISSNSTNSEEIKDALGFEIVNEYIPKPLTIDII